MAAEAGSTPPHRSPPPAGDSPDALVRGKHHLDPPGHGVDGDPGRGAPAWRRVTAGEKRIPAAVAAAVAIGLQVALPNQLTLMSRFLLPTIEAALLVALVSLNPGRMDRISRPVRTLGLALIAVASLANAYSAGLLIDELVQGTHGYAPLPLLSTGAGIYLTNIIVFALWYFELDRGGPAARACGLKDHPDFLFAQMTAPDVADPQWEPQFADYLYVSFTNATAFSPTDTLPLTRWAKMIMMLQSAVSLVTVALIVARAVNILK